MLTCPVLRNLHRASLSVTLSTSALTHASKMYSSTQSTGSLQAPLPYANKIFRSSTNTPNGEVSQYTVFHYNQSADNPNIVWAEYSGGSITRGFLIATVQSDQSLDARYQHVNVDGELRTGVCRSVPETLEGGRIRLLERWRWTSGDGSSGESVVEEVRREDEVTV